LNGKVLGKPKSKAGAIEMLQQLSGQTHEVYTGVVIKDTGAEHQLVDCTTVRFQELKLEDIIHYIEEHEAMDKAGSYGIQDWIGVIGIRGIEGDFYNVMGLPVSKLLGYLPTKTTKFTTK